MLFKLTLPDIGEGVVEAEVQRWFVQPGDAVAEVVIGNIAFRDSIQMAMDAIKAVLAADPRVLKDPAPVIAVGELGSSAVNILVRPWCSKDVYWDLRWDLTRALKEALERAGCSLPSQQHDVHLFQESRRAA